MRIALQRVFGVYCWLVFLAVAVSTLVIVLVVPGITRRRAVTRSGAWAYLWITGTQCRVLCEDRLPLTPCIVVANHTSYIDGLIMTAVLPPRFSFVIKKEMSTMPVANWLLKRIGSEFVERNNQRRGALDARRVLRAAERGQALAFFPEGTFSKERGLLKFHTGAFTTAARMGWPVVPAVIRGARNILPAHRALPAPGSVSVEFIEVLQPQGEDRTAANALRDRCRNDMMAALGEPDLAA